MYAPSVRAPTTVILLLKAPSPRSVCASQVSTVVSPVDEHGITIPAGGFNSVQSEYTPPLRYCSLLSTPVEEGPTATTEMVTLAVEALPDMLVKVNENGRILIVAFKFTVAVVINTSFILRNGDALSFLELQGFADRPFQFIDLFNKSFF